LKYGCIQHLTTASELMNWNFHICYTLPWNSVSYSSFKWVWQEWHSSWMVAEIRQRRRIHRYWSSLVFATCSFSSTVKLA
jgi:hypothetical protein